jgi:uncharacterized protein (TIGR04255 family)
MFTRIEQVQIYTQTLVGAPMAAGTQEVTQGWHLKSSDGAWTAAVLPDQFSLETTSYTQWDDFRSWFEKLAAGVESVAPPTMEQRLGLRYLDRLRDLGVSEPAGWGRWIHSAWLGPPLHEVLGEAVTQLRQEVELNLGGEERCTLRHGVVSDPSAAPGGGALYLLDFDLFRQQARKFTSAGVIAGAQDFHQKADALFRQIITEELLRYLQGDDNV